MSGIRGGVFSGSRRSAVATAQVIHASASVLVWPGDGLDSCAGAHVFGQSGCVAPCRFLRFEVPDTVCLGVLDAGLFHGGFPAGALLACCLEFVQASAFGGFAAECDLLGDLGELVFEGAAGGVGPFARTVWLAAAEDPQAVSEGVVVEPPVLPPVCTIWTRGPRCCTGSSTRPAASHPATLPRTPSTGPPTPARQPRPWPASAVIRQVRGS